MLQFDCFFVTYFSIQLVANKQYNSYDKNRIRILNKEMLNDKKSMISYCFQDSGKHQ